MHRILLVLVALLGFSAPAAAQCLAVGGVNTVPQTGVACQMESTVTTYAASSIGLAPAASATDLACITGSASRVTRVKQVTFSGVAGTLVTIPVTVLKRASANTGGTPAATTALPVPYPVDSQNAAATATTIAWTANPTIVDTAPGILAARNASLNTTSALVAGPPLVFDWTNTPFSQSPTLRGVAQQLCVNIGATSPSSGVVNISFLWTEAVQ